MRIQGASGATNVVTISINGVKTESSYDSWGNGASMRLVSVEAGDIISTSGSSRMQNFYFIPPKANTNPIGIGSVLSFRRTA